VLGRLRAVVDPEHAADDPVELCGDRQRPRSCAITGGALRRRVETLHLGLERRRDRLKAAMEDHRPAREVHVGHRQAVLLGERPHPLDVVGAGAVLLGPILAAGDPPLPWRTGRLFVDPVKRRLRSHIDRQVDLRLRVDIADAGVRRIELAL
jgi:hypothetical protein